MVFPAKYRKVVFGEEVEKVLIPLRTERISLFITLLLRAKDSGHLKKETRLSSKLCKAIKVTKLKM